MKRYFVLTILLITLIFLFTGCGENAMEKKFKTFLTGHLKEVQPLMKEMNQTYWESAISGKKEDFNKYAELEYKLKKTYSDKKNFSLLKEIKESGQIKNESLNRQLDILYNSYLGNQIDSTLLKKIVEKSAAVESQFSVFRSKMGNKTITANEIKNILKNETDSKKRREAWMASKQVGKEVAADIIELVKLRNEAAKKLGFKNYYLMSLSLSEQNIDELTKIFKNLENYTNEPFAALKSELDNILANNYGIGVGGMMPWHYHDPFFQEGPLVYEVNLDQYFEKQDIKELVRQFYAGIDLPVDDILKRSDLYEKEGKNPHAFCTDIDREGDVRILCNLKNDEGWMETILHELGHGVYDKYLDPNIPFLLREPAHSFTTEAVAMLFGRLSRNAYWLQDMISLDDAERDEIANVVQKSLRMKQLIFARWCQVMFRFEKSLYENPDQDLNALWWNLKEKYQLIKKPNNRNEPDWATKIHIALYPVYYHNYMLGELFASQLHNSIIKNVLKSDSPNTVSYVGEKAIGKYLKQNVFKAGNKYPWNEMIKKSTGDYLSAKYFVDQFVNL